MMKTPVIAACLLLGCLGTSMAAAAAPEASKVTGEVVADVTSVKPGDSLTLAIVLKTNPEWHIYWKNPGDAGMATRFTLRLPEGFTAEPVAFPLPTTFQQPGNLVAYGYTGSTVFLVRVTTPRQLEAGKDATLHIDASWLSCDAEQCVPGKQKLSIALPVTAQTQPNEATSAIFENARRAVPADAPPADLIAAITPEPLPQKDAGMEPAISIAWKRTPASVEVFPLAVEGLEIKNVAAKTQKDRTRISVDARILGGQRLTSDRLPVLVTYAEADGHRGGFYTSLMLAAKQNPQR
jgi:DsbC/DsbD-like thiol-disulfide interchange protein